LAQLVFFREDESFVIAKKGWRSVAGDRYLAHRDVQTGTSPISVYMIGLAVITLVISDHSNRASDSRH
jgi:hypothetical protein